MSVLSDTIYFWIWSGFTFYVDEEEVRVKRNFLLLLLIVCIWDWKIIQDNLDLLTDVSFFNQIRDDSDEMSST